MTSPLLSNRIEGKTRFPLALWCWQAAVTLLGDVRSGTENQNFQGYT